MKQTRKGAPKKPHPDESFVEFVADQLSAIPELFPRRMFGGFGFYSGEAFFAIIASGRLYLKTDEASRQEYVARGMTPFQPSETQTLKNYYEVPVDVLEDRTLLTAWARAAIRVADVSRN